jgi:(R,R)-butanediol dehydrogenase/meso-butanediol dehydrogenase/diacetyl reductase
VLSGDEDLVSVISDEGLIPSAVYEVSGSQQGLELALACAPKGCRVVLVGLQGRPTELNLRDISIREIELVGTNAHAFVQDFPTALELLAARPAGWRDVAPVALSLDRLVDEGLEPLSTGQGTRIKTLIDPWTESTRDTETS